jgi:hypothetical protein
LPLRSLSSVEAEPASAGGIVDDLA